MALGRGGDQVAVKQKGGYIRVFGGLSKGVEKRDKVRTRVIAATLSDHIKSSDRVFIMGHKNSDLDCIGAAVGMWAAIRKGLEKQASIVVNRNQTLAGADRQRGGILRRGGAFSSAPLEASGNHGTLSAYRGGYPFGEFCGEPGALTGFPCR